MPSPLTPAPVASLAAGKTAFRVNVFGNRVAIPAPGHVTLGRGKNLYTVNALPAECGLHFSVYSDTDIDAGLPVRQWLDANNLCVAGYTQPQFVSRHE